MLLCVLSAARNASSILYSNSPLGVFFVVGLSCAKAFEDVVASASISEDIFTTSGIAPAVVVTTFASASEDVATTFAVFSHSGRLFIVVCVTV